MCSVPVQVAHGFIGNKRISGKASFFKIGMIRVEPGIQYSYLDPCTGIYRFICLYGLNAPGGGYSCVGRNIVGNINYLLRLNYITGMHIMQQLHLFVICGHKSNT
ncbi:hypothetical protein SDC9_116943 [bioreactor metagenome]|uniref:Uncharacterized protein n=1 Tax=bioreactor metagenome TaxID=1076179 RepID=A0A645BXL9_9ZZZZ